MASEVTLAGELRNSDHVILYGQLRPRREQSTRVLRAPSMQAAGRYFDGTATVVVSEIGYNQAISSVAMQSARPAASRDNNH
jgi:hypothetical protein